MSSRLNVTYLRIIEPEQQFPSQRTALIMGLTVVLFGAGLVIRQFSLHDPTPTYIAAGASLVALLSFLMLKFLRQYSVSVDGDHLVVKTGDGTQRIPLVNLRPQGLRVLDLSRYCTFNIDERLRSTASPYTKCGSYPLLNGELAILLVTDPSKVCRLRSYNDGMTLLLSLRHPEKLRALLLDDAAHLSIESPATLKSLLQR
jgi:hypothetical protein